MTEDEDFHASCMNLKTKIEALLIQMMSEIPTDLQNLVVKNCALSGGSISSIYHNEPVNDFDIYSLTTTGLEKIEFFLKETNLETVPSSRPPGVLDDNKDEYIYVEENGKIKTANAITLNNKIQFVLNRTYESWRQEYDFVHCLPYYSITGARLYISKEQWKAIRDKKLKYANPNHIHNNIFKRTEKYKSRGWTA
jgi:hypothetical protein